MSEEILLVEEKQIESGPIQIWTINRPKVLNALNPDVLKAIDEAGKKLQAQLEKNLTSCRALMIMGAGDKAFVAGADIAGMQKMSPQEAEAFGRLAQTAFTRIERLPIPTVAVVQGFALGGGCEIAMSCDVIIAGSKARFGQPEAWLGLIPGFGGTARFVDRLGTGKALQYLYSGEQMPAPDALRYGLVQELCPENEDLMTFALGHVTRMTLKSGPVAIKMLKEVVRSRTNKLFDEIQDREAKAFHEIFRSADKDEGIAAFLEKRRANFTGR